MIPNEKKTFNTIFRIKQLDEWNLEKAMAPNSSPLAWKIPWTGEPGRLQSMGSRTVGHDWATSPSLFTFMHLRRTWQPTPVFLPGESPGWGSLVGYCLWGHTESTSHDFTRLKWLSSSSSRWMKLFFMYMKILRRNRTINNLWLTFLSYIKMKKYRWSSL